LASKEIEPGMAIISKRDGPIKFVSINQGARSFFGKFEESPDGSLLVALSDGRMTRIGDQESWENGEILIAEGNTVLWSRRLERPNDCQVANCGNVVVNDWLRIKEKLGGKIYVFSSKGETLFERIFDSNLAACAISQDGTYALLSTCFRIMLSI
jgi:sugar lactone lactonase YvrE